LKRNTLSLVATVLTVYGIET